jgi:hypothetical protein
MCVNLLVLNSLRRLSHTVYAWYQARLNMADREFVDITNQKQKYGALAAILDTTRRDLMKRSLPQ